MTMQASKLVQVSYQEENTMKHPSSTGGTSLPVHLYHLARLSVMRAAGIGFMAVCLLLPGVSAAGSLDSPAAPTATGSAMFTITDIYNRLNTGAAGAKRSGAFAEPSAGPTAGTGHTLDEVMLKTPAVDNTNGLTPTTAPNGKTFWGLNANSGTWGLQTGTNTTLTDTTISPSSSAAGAGDILSGQKAYVNGALVIGNVNPGFDVTGANNNNGSLVLPIPAGLYDGTTTATAFDTNLNPNNIKSGVTIFGTSGNSFVVDTSNANATAGSILAGKTAWVQGVKLTGTIPTVGGTDIQPGTSNQPIAVGYHASPSSVYGSPTLVPANIKSGTSIFGVTGDSNVVDTSAATAVAGDILLNKTAYVGGVLVQGSVFAGDNLTGTPGSLTIAIQNRLYSGNKTATAQDFNLLSTNIKSGVTIFGVAGNANVVDTSTGNAVAGDIANGKKAYVGGSLVTGSVVAGSNVTGANGSLTMTIPNGLYSGGKTATAADSSLTAANIKNGVTIFGTAGSFTGGTTCTGTLNGTRWCDNGDGTVTDMLGDSTNNNAGKGLIWLKNAGWGGTAPFWATTITGVNAHDKAASLRDASNLALTDGSVEGDWRLPTFTELKGLTRGTEAVLAATPRAFTGIATEYWSSTTAASTGSLNSAFEVFLTTDMIGGGSAGTTNNSLKSNSHNVWPVRGQ